MPPLPPPETRRLLAAGARRRASDQPTTASLVGTLRKLGEQGQGLVALLDARGVGGERHLLSAWAHLGRAREGGASRLRDPGAEFLLYVAGDDQLTRALEKVGVSDSTREFVLALERPREIVPTLNALGLVADPTVYPRPVTVEVLNRLGIDEADRAAVPADAWEGLILERVALVDLAPARSSQKTATS